MDKAAENKYRYAFFRSRPQHDRCDDFSIRHPKMQMGQRAKIFSPYSALRGFDTVIDAVRRLYVEKRELNEEEQQRMNLTLGQLYERTQKQHTAKEGPISASVTYYVPCADENHEAYGCRGSYETVSGPVRRVDPILTMTLTIGEQTIDFADIATIKIQEEL